jgi:hypothetical protein
MLSSDMGASGGWITPLYEVATVAVSRSIRSMG